jgi:hypothetical protein
MVDQCTVPACGQPSGASLEGQYLCRGHFISRCYSQIEACTVQLTEKPHRNPLAVNVVMKTLSEIADQTTTGLIAGDLNTMEHEKLFDILLSVANLMKRLRRGPRKRASVPLRLQFEVPGHNWVDETTTLEVSVHGALIECRIPVASGEVVTVERLDIGRRAKAKVKWVTRKADGSQMLGIELLDCEDFWGFKL